MKNKHHIFSDFPSTTHTERAVFHPLVQLELTNSSQWATNTSYLRKSMLQLSVSNCEVNVPKHFITLSYHQCLTFILPGWAFKFL